jgi:hypothetical protein
MAGSADEYAEAPLTARMLRKKLYLSDQSLELARTARLCAHRHTRQAWKPSGSSAWGRSGCR